MLKCFAIFFLLLGAYCLIVGNFILGGILCCFGGWFTGLLGINLRSFGLVQMIATITYGVHYNFSIWVVASFVLGIFFMKARSASERYGVKSVSSLRFDAGMYRATHDSTSSETGGGSRSGSSASTDHRRVNGLNGSSGFDGL